MYCIFVSVLTNTMVFHSASFKVNEFLNYNIMTDEKFYLIPTFVSILSIAIVLWVFLKVKQPKQENRIEHYSVSSEGKAPIFTTRSEGSGLIINSKTNKYYEVIYKPNLKYLVQGKEVSKEDFDLFVENFNK